jgi:hypothetical protein
VVYWSKGRGFVHGDMGARHLGIWDLLQRDGNKGRDEEMSDTLVLVIGLFCTAITILGAIMTVQEFKKDNNN